MLRPGSCYYFFIYETVLLFSLVLLNFQRLSPIVMNACRTKICRRHGDDGGYDDARRGILKAFSCCKAYFILILMQK